MADPFKYQDSANYPSRKPYAVTPHDTNALTEVPKAIYVGTAGNVVLRGVGASADVTFKNVTAGQILDVVPSHIRATGTTAADIIALA